MNMQELFPVMMGLVLGPILSIFRPSRRVRLGSVLIACAGASATLLSGEFRIHWSFVLIDTLLVAVSASASLLAVRLMQLAARRSAH